MSCRRRRTVSGSFRRGTGPLDQSTNSDSNARFARFSQPSSTSAPALTFAQFFAAHSPRHHSTTRLLTGISRKWEKFMFKKSSFCGNSTCVEVSIDRDVVRVRDSKVEASAELVFDSAEWAEFVRGVKNNEFDG